MADLVNYNGISQAFKGSQLQAFVLICTRYYPIYHSIQPGYHHVCLIYYHIHTIILSCVFNILSYWYYHVCLIYYHIDTICVTWLWCECLVGMEDIFRALLPTLGRILLLTRHPEGLVPDVDEGPLHNGQHLQMCWDHHTRGFDPWCWVMIKFLLMTPLTYLDPPGQMMSLSSTCSTMALVSLQNE